MVIKKDRGLIVALDMRDQAAALRIARDLRGIDANIVFKVGRILEMAAGIGICAGLKEASWGIPIIYDGKIADIPEVSAEIAKEAYLYGADAVICHGIVGCAEAIKALGMGQVISVVAMSHPEADLINRLRMETARRSREMDGAVFPATAPQMIQEVKGLLSPKTFIISPGVITQGAEPGAAIRMGADYEIVGRAITRAPDPAEAAKRLYETIMGVE